MSRILQPTPDAIDRAAAALHAGELVGLPTETVYGLAALGLSAPAVAQIYAAKDRPSFNPLILHTVRSLDELDQVGIIDLSQCTERGVDAARRLAAGVWPGPLTLVLPRGRAVPDLTTAGLPTVAIRQPRHPVARALLHRVGAPLAAPSANRSGRISPTTAQAVIDELSPSISMVLDGGPCEVGLESSVVHLSPDGEATLLRPGGLDAATLSGLLGREIALGKDSEERPQSPGTGSRHYAPRTPFLQLSDRLTELPAPLRSALRARCTQARRIAVLCWTQSDADNAQRMDLSGQVSASAIDPKGDLARTAQGLYATLRRLDASGVDLMLVEPFPPQPIAAQGLGFALADRMARATTPWPNAD